MNVNKNGIPVQNDPGIKKKNKSIHGGYHHKKPITIKLDNGLTYVKWVRK